MWRVAVAEDSRDRLTYQWFAIYPRDEQGILSTVHTLYKVWCNIRKVIFQIKSHLLVQ